MLKPIAAIAAAFALSCADRAVPPTGPEAAPAGKATVSRDAPDAPTGLRVAALTDTSARIEWDAVEGATDYDINYRTLSGRWTNWPHAGASRTHSTIYGLEPDTEYRWAVRAENSDGPSGWTFGQNFTTLTPTDLSPPADLSDRQYIQLTMDGSLNAEEKELAEAAAAKWNALIVAGPLESLHVTLSVIPKSTYQPYVDPRGTATTTGFKQVRGEQIISECAVRVISLSVYNTAYHHEINRTRQSNLWAHEIGHCLGIGLGNRWHSQVQQDGYVRNIHTNEDEPLPHYFTGPSTRAEFLRLAKGGWDLEAYPYIIPLGDPNHLKSPLFSRNYLAYDFWGNEFHKSVSSLDAALLEDLGYVVDWSMVEDTQMTSGRRHIHMKRDRTKRIVIDPEKVYDSVEILLFPDHPLVFINPVNEGTALGGWGSGITRYWAKWYWEIWQTGGHFRVFHDDPTINWDNVVDWWYGETGYFGYQDHYGKHDKIGPENYASGKANQIITHKDW